MKNLKLSTKLHIVSGILVLVAVTVGVIGIVGTRKTNAGLETVYHVTAHPVRQLRAIVNDYAVATVDAVNKANAGIFTAEETLKDLETASANIKNNWKDYMANSLTPEKAKVAKEIEVLYVPADAAVEKLRAFLAGKTGSVKGTLDGHDGPLYATIDPISAKITELADLHRRVVKEEYTAAQERFVFVLWLSIGVLVLGTVLGGGLGWVVIRFQ